MRIAVLRNTYLEYWKGSIFITYVDTTFNTYYILTKIIPFTREAIKLQAMISTVLHTQFG